MVADALDTNLLGSLRVLQAVLPALRRSAGPRIVNNSSGAEAELGLGEATASLATTIENLHPQHNGQWLDRFGQPSVYA